MPSVIWDGGTAPLETGIREFLANSQNRRMFREQESKQAAATDYARRKQIADEYMATLKRRREEGEDPETLRKEALDFAVNNLGLKEFVQPVAEMQTYGRTPAEQIKKMGRDETMQRFPTMAPDIKNAGTYQSMYGAAMPKEIQEQDIRRQGMTAPDFAESNRILGGVQMKPAEAAQETRLAPLTKAQTGLAEADTAFTQGPKTFQTRAAGTASLANAAESRANVPLRQAQTVSELQKQRGMSALNMSDAELPPLENAPAIVRMIVERTYDPMLMRRMKPEEQEQVLGMAQRYDPSINIQDYTTQVATRKDFTAGKTNNNIRAINTAVHHLESLQKAGDALENSDLQLWNKIANYTLEQTGDPRVTRFKVAADAVAGEMAAVFKAASGTDQEIKAWREQLKAAQGPEQIRTAIDTMTELMAGRLDAIQQQWDTNMGVGKDFGDAGKIIAKIKSDLAKLHDGGSTTSAADSYLKKHGY
jgi:hypothetical protein